MGSRTPASSSASRSPVATSASTTRPARPRSCRRPSSRCSASSTTSPGVRRPASSPRASGSSCSARRREELSGSEWAHVVHGHLGGLPPQVDLAAEQALAELLQRRVARRRCHQRPRPVRRRTGPGAGGVLPSRHGIGVSVSVASVAGGDAFVALFAESIARAIVTVTTDKADALVALAQLHGVPMTPLGPDRWRHDRVEGVFDLPVAEPRRVARRGCPSVLGGLTGARGRLEGGGIDNGPAGRRDRQCTCQVPRRGVRR